MELRDDPSSEASSQIIIALNFKQKTGTKHNRGVWLLNSENILHLILFMFSSGISEFVNKIEDCLECVKVSNRL